jgi:hypothetical protein
MSVTTRARLVRSALLVPRVACTTTATNLSRSRRRWQLQETALAARLEPTMKTAVGRLSGPRHGIATVTWARNRKAPSAEDAPVTRSGDDVTVHLHRAGAGLHHRKRARVAQFWSVKCGQPRPRHRPGPLHSGRGVSVVVAESSDGVNFNMCARRARPRRFDAASFKRPVIVPNRLRLAPLRQLRDSAFQAVVDRRVQRKASGGAPLRRASPRATRGWAVGVKDPVR